MEGYPIAAVERAMKVQEVILRARAKKITWIQAAEILGMAPRSLRETASILEQRYPETEWARKSSVWRPKEAAPHMA